MTVVKVGTLNFVVLEEVAAVGWSGPHNCPVITLKSNGLVYCPDYATTDSTERERKLDALVSLLLRGSQGPRYDKG